jgi:Asp/Glu/hydantoin racemase
MARTRGGERLFELLVADAAIRAEADGYDALAIGVIQDSGLKLARTLVDIPVAGYGQAAALLSRCWGSHLGVLAFNPELFPLISSRLNTHVPRAVIAVEDIRLSYEEILRSFTDAGAAERLREQVSAAAARLVSAGADVLVPGQMVLSEAVWHAGLRQVAGAVLIDGLAATVTLAESMVALRQRSGITAGPNTGGWRQAEAPIRDMITRCARTAVGGIPT